MTYAFPLLYLPRREMFVDDDTTYLDALRMALPPRLARSFYSRPEDARSSLEVEGRYWGNTEKLLARALAWRTDHLGEAELYVMSYFRDWRRFHLTSALFVDFHMPGMDGLKLLSAIDALPSRRILLTGVADAEVAVKAFNRGTIHKFVPKNSPDFSKALRECAEDMHLLVCEHLGQLLRPTLTDAQVELLQEPGVAKGLWDKVRTLRWTEFVVVGQPFGILGMGPAGPLQWLQLETRESLKGLAEAAAETGYSAADVKAIERGDAVPVAELLQSVGLPDEQSMAPLERIADVPLLFGGTIDLDVEVFTAREYGLDSFSSYDEEMRGLLRDVVVADQCATLQDGADVGMRDALAHLVATARMSAVHAQALESAMKTAQLPPALAATVAAALSSAGLGESPYGDR